MNLAELQSELRHFAAERDWQPFHTPKNLSTALMVEAAELAEIFQWMTPDESRLAHRDAGAKERIGEEVADVLLYLLQVADHSEIDLAQAVKSKLARNAMKYPAKQVIARVSPARASVPGMHVLLDYENVQPTGEELRAMVPDASQVWVFHGPHQRQVEQRFALFGDQATAVPISKTGKNALDFHLSFYMGYIAARNPASAMVVVSNDKGYEPMLAHARAMGFAVRQVGHGQSQPDASMKPVKASKAVAAAKPAAKKVAAKKSPVKKAAATPPVFTLAPAKKAAAKKSTARKGVAKSGTPQAAKASAAPVVAAKALAGATVAAKAANVSPDSAVTTKRLTDSLRKMDEKRPTKPTSLWRSLKSFLGATATEEAVEVALARLIVAGVVKVDSVKGVSYPKFDAESRPATTQP